MAQATRKAIHDMSGTQLIRLFGIASLLFIAGVVIKPFWTAVAWAGLLAIIFWPTYDRLLCRWEPSPNISAAFFTFLLMTGFSMPFLWGFAEVQRELPTLDELTDQLDAKNLITLPWIGNLPFIGIPLSKFITSIQAEPSKYAEVVRDLLSSLVKKGSLALQHIPRNIASLVLTVISLFFFLRDGKSLTDQLSRGLSRLIGPHADDYIFIIKSTTQAVAYGVFGSALLQGFIAGIGFFFFNFKTPLLLGLVTAIAALIPVFGTILIWGPISIWLIISQGDMTTGLGLMAWGAFLINPADNIFRPLVISHSAHQPLQLIIIGVMGGLFSLGPVGVFIGPLCLTTLAHAWRCWISAEAIQKSH